MIHLLKSIAAIMMGNGHELPIPTDSTIYRIETMTRKYCGRILYQDNVVIKLKIGQPKPVKILKSNIKSISPVESETTRQYFQWQKQHTTTSAMAS